MPQQRGDDGRVSDKEARKDEGRRRKKDALFFSLFSALHLQSLSLDSFVSDFRTGKPSELHSHKSRTFRFQIVCLSQQVMVMSAPGLLCL